MEKSKLEMDSEHMKIKEQIDALYKKIETLQDEIGANEGIQRALARYRAAREEALTQGKKHSVQEDTALENNIKELEEKVKALRSEYTIIEEQDKVREEIEALWKKFYESEIHLEPIHLKLVKSYRNSQGNVEIKAVSGSKLWYYENSQYASPDVLIQVNEKGEPTEILRFVRNSETMGYLMKVHQKIIIEG